MAGETEMTTTGDGKGAKKPMEDIEAQDGSAEGEAKPTGDPLTMYWQIAATSCIILYGIGFGISFFSGAVLIGAFFGIVASVSVIINQSQLQDTDSMRQVQNQLRHQVNDFSLENDKLSASNDRLESELGPLKETAAQLDKIAEETGCQVNKLKQLVLDNQKYLDGMKECVYNDIVTQMMGAVLDSERDGDGHFSDGEIRRLAVRLNGLPAITVDKEKFLEKVRKDRSMNSVLTLIQSITDPSIPEKERVFTINEEEALEEKFVDVYDEDD